MKTSHPVPAGTVSTVVEKTGQPSFCSVNSESEVVTDAETAEWFSSDPAYVDISLYLVPDFAGGKMSAQQSAGKNM